MRSRTPQKWTEKLRLRCLEMAMERSYFGGDEKELLKKAEAYMVFVEYGLVESKRDTEADDVPAQYRH
jgi:hypothetical protein